MKRLIIFISSIIFPVITFCQQSEVTPLPQSDSITYDYTEMWLAGNAYSYYDEYQPGKVKVIDILELDGEKSPYLCEALEVMESKGWELVEVFSDRQNTPRFLLRRKIKIE